MTAFLLVIAPYPQIIMKLLRPFELIAFVFLAASFSSLHAQTTVNVGAGQIIAEEDLLSGNFDGMMFDLDGNTTFEINGGGTFDRVGESNNPFDFNGATVNINAGGVFGDHGGGPPSVVANVTLNLHDEGTILRTLRPDSGAVVNVFGGAIEYGLRALDGSTNNIYGGCFESFVELRAGSVTNIEGGYFFLSFRALAESNVTFTGGEFSLNGIPFDGTEIPGPGLLSGTFPDGRQFVLSGGFDPNANVSLNIVDLPAIDTTPIVVDAINGYPSNGLRSGQSMSMYDGGVLPKGFVVDRATMNIDGGEIGKDLKIIESHVSISGGDIGKFVDIYQGSTIDITGGNVDSGLGAHSGSTVNIRGGFIDNGFEAYEGSVVNISGGEVGVFNSRYGNEVNISGGTISEYLGVDPTSTINLFVQQLLLDDNPIDLNYGETINIDAGAYSNLTASLADGSLIQLHLNRHPKDSFGISPYASLTVTLVPEPCSLALLLSSVVCAIGYRCRPCRP